MMESRNDGKRADRALFCLTLSAFVLILLFPAASGNGVRSGLLLCYRAVLPSVFPSLILTDLLFSGSGEVVERTVGRFFSGVFRVSPRGGVAFIAGLLSGFPVGAITVARDVRRGLLSREEGEYLLSFVNNTGPAFLVGGIGLTLFGSVKLGWALYLLQIPVALIVGLLFRPAAPFVPHAAPTDEIRFTDPVAATARAAETCVRIAGFICFFSVLSSLLSVFLPGGLPLALASSVLEVGCGASLAAGLRFPFPAVPLVALTVCFSGCSVHFQTISAIAGTGMKTDRYWKGKIVSGALGFSLSLLLCLTN